MYVYRYYVTNFKSFFSFYFINMHLDLQQIVTKLIHQIFRVQFTTTYSRLKKVWHQKTNQDESIIIRNDGAVARRSTKSVFFF